MTIHSSQPKRQNVFTRLSLSVAVKIQWFNVDVIIYLCQWTLNLKMQRYQSASHIMNNPNSIYHFECCSGNGSFCQYRSHRECYHFRLPVYLYKNNNSYNKCQC